MLITAAALQGFEPYMLAARSSVPWYDERFRGYGLDKVVHAASMAASGVRWVVHPRAFVVHVPHARPNKLRDSTPVPSGPPVSHGNPHYPLSGSHALGTANLVNLHAKRFAMMANTAVQLKSMYEAARAEMGAGIYIPRAALACGNGTVPRQLQPLWPW